MRLELLVPEICLAATAIAVIATDLISRRKALLTAISLAGIGIAAGFTISMLGTSAQTLGNGLFALDGFSLFLKLLFLGLASMVILASADYVKRMQDFHGEYHALILTATLGMMLTASAVDIISIFVSVELTAVSFYALVGFLKDARSSESSLKYILLGAINSAVLLYGLALVFGFTGQTHLSDITAAIGGIAGHGIPASAGLILGLGLVLAGFGFKVAAVPFHMWAPDVYEGAPTPVTLYLSAGSKVAGFAVLLRFLLSAFIQPITLSHNWGLVLAVVSALGMTLGNILAIPQANIKRLLAYSSIAHSGYMLIALASLGMAAAISASIQSSLLFYAAAFVLAEVAAFTVVIMVSHQLGSDLIADYAGLGKRSPLTALALTLGLISLIGLPPTAGFMAKFYLFSQAAHSGLIWLVVIAVVNSVISAYYYLRIVKTMWMDNPNEETAIVSATAPRLVLVIACLGILFMGIVPAVIMKAAQFGSALFIP